MSGWLNIGIAALVAALVSPPAAVDETLAAARSLYASAAYEESLALLDKLATAEHTPEEGRGIDQYRAYCLLALGRPADAERAIAAVVVSAPTFRPSPSEASPRIQAAFRDVRIKMLPMLAQTRYASAKANFDAKRFPEAAAQFSELLDALADPDLAQLVTTSPLADIRTLAGGFKDLSMQAAAPPPPPPPPAPVAVAAPAPPPVAVPRVYSSDDHDVTPPVAVLQALPTFPAAAGPVNPGVLEIVINEAGDVESAAMRQPIGGRYDSLMLAAARKWKYHPATRSGAPVKYRRMMQVAVRAP